MIGIRNYRSTPPITSGASSPLHGLADFVFHDDRPVLLNHEPARSNKRPHLQGLQILISGLEPYLNDCNPRQKQTPFNWASTTYTNPRTRSI